MDIRLTTADAGTLPGDALAVFAGTAWRDELADLDAAFGGHLFPWLEAQGFEGKGAPLVTASFGQVKARLLMVVGVGDGGAESLRKAAARVATESRSQRVADLVLRTGLGAEGIRTIVEHLASGNYVYDAYKAEADRRPALASVTLTGVEDTAETRAILGRSAVRAGWQRWARDLVNAPPADLYPETLAQAAVERLGKLPHVQVEVWDIDRCTKESCVGIVAVGQGSARPGCMIRVRYSPPGAREHIALVGKGVTFDSGGLSLKPSDAMQTMRCDMGGAAVMLATTGAAAELGVPVAIDTFVAAVENMNDGNSYKLGDILTYRNGVTVEIHNTDAEGRLVLADALIEACKVPGVSRVVDAATLTGACVVAIGSDFTGLFTADDGLAHELAQAAAADGEGLWRLPLHAPYAEKLRGDWSRLKNVGGREAGASTAALFLQHFVTDAVQWAHLDIAGSAWRDKGNGLGAAGGTGEMVRSLTTWIQRLVR